MSAAPPEAHGRIACEYRDDGVAVLRLDNPARKNALDDAMLRELLESLRRLATDPRCRLLVLRGAGLHFCTGRDVAGLHAERVDGGGPFDALVDLVEALYRFPKPTMAVVRGYCLGLGAALAVLADLTLVDTQARIGFPEVKIGVAPSFTTVALLRCCGAKAAAHLLLTGEPVDGAQAARLGLATQAWPADRLEPAAEECVQALARGSTVAQMACKVLMRDSAQRDLDATLQLALATAAASAATADAREGYAAFREKRPAAWQQPPGTGPS